MSKYISDYINTRIKSVDNDSLVYIFKSGYVWGMARERIIAEYPLIYPVNPTDYFSFYDTMLKRKADQIINVLYKNNNGKWVKLLKLIFDNPYSDPFDTANLAENEEKYELHVKHIPEMDYVDKDGNIYRIQERDNDRNYQKKQPVYIDELNKNTIKLSQFSIENPTYGFQLRHMMNDLRIQFLDKTIDKNNLLVNLNGLFVEPSYLASHKDSIFIKNARWTYKCYNGKLKENATPASTKKSTIVGPTASLNFSDEDFYRNYSIKVRLFQWNDVTISPWIHVEHVNYKLVIAEFKNVRVMDSLIFSQELPPDRTIIICDGMIMNPSEYIIDGKKVQLRYLGNEFLRLYDEFKSKNMISALNDAAYYVNNRYYHAIVFEDKDPTRDLVLRKTTPIDIGILGYNSVLFDEARSSDFIIVDGVFLPYVIEANGIVKFPKFNDDNLYFREDLFPFKDRRITKIELVNYIKTIQQ